MEKAFTTEKFNRDAVLAEKITRELRMVNNEMRKLIYKTPLSNYREIARLDYLAKRQLQLLEIPISKTLPLRMVIHLDNAKDTANFLRGEYNNALSKGRIRKPPVEDETEE